MPEDLSYKKCEKDFFSNRKGCKSETWIYIKKGRASEKEKVLR